jgi:transcriptional regulator
MYTPSPFHETDPKVIQTIVDHYPLATLFTNSKGQLLANHLPFLLDVENNKYTLLAHVSNHNELLTSASTGDEVMVVYRGEDSYISPNWYPSKQEHHRHVPTWNYQAVHFYGTIELIQEQPFLMNVVGRLTRLHEARVKEPAPWKMGDAPRDYLHEEIKGITGIRISAHHVVAKSKLSQNREPNDFENVKNKMKEQGKHFLYEQMNQCVLQRKENE